MAYTIDNLVNTSADDCRYSLPFITDKAMLRKALEACLDKGMKTKAHYIKRRIKKLEETS